MRAARRGSDSARGFVLVLLVCGGLLSSATPRAIAAGPEEVVFDPSLSLTGNPACKATEEDPVPDPGCPGGTHPPAGSFTSPRAVITDNYGDIYVASYGNEVDNGEGGRIDIFNPAGAFLTEIPDPSGPKSLAVDSKGNLYVFQFAVGKWRKVELYKPSAYTPATGDIAYQNAPTVVETTTHFYAGLAVSRANDHLFVHLGNKVEEFSSAEEGNAPLAAIGVGKLYFPLALGLAVDEAHKRIYVGDQRSTAPEDYLIDIFQLESPHAFLGRIDGSALPGGQFASEPTIAVNEANGSVFAYPSSETVYQFTEGGEFIRSIQHFFKYTYGAQIGVDNGAFSPNAGYLFVPSKPTGEGHAFAFGPRKVCEPLVESVSFETVTESEAELVGEVEPCGLATSYTFEYTTLESFEVEGFSGAQVAKTGSIPAGLAPVRVQAPLAGLLPGTGYRLRLTASNELGEDEGESEFTTYPFLTGSQACPNEAFRTGRSALLPDCRAYELVSPPATNARAPRGVGAGSLGMLFSTREASPAGDKVSFITEGGALPGSEGTGSLVGDPYLSVRGATGWSTAAVGPAGGESVSLLPGSTSPDQNYSFWNTGGVEGTAVVEGVNTSYIRYPDGHSALLGRGTLADDPAAAGALISENGSHIIFTSIRRLEPEAAPVGVVSIYDRTPDEITHVVSLLPGDVPQKAGEKAVYVGASLDGKGVAFEINGTLYLRYNDEKTFKVGEGVTFAGIAEGGSRVFYLEGASLVRDDVLSGEIKTFASGGSGVVPVNVSADGSTAYLVSTDVLTTAANPNGAKAKAGKQNLYLSEEGAIGFVGTVTEEDVLGEATGIGLGQWTPHVVSYGEGAEDPSRTTPDGAIMVFESRANLTAYDSQGNIEDYLYDAAAGELLCLSCNPTGVPAATASSLQSVALFLGEPQPLSIFGFVPVLRADGRRVAFESSEPLVPTDTDGLQDVYEWEAQGVGSCMRPGGCIFLISSGQSTRVNYLYGVSDSGDDIFFRSADLLLPADEEETPSIYDARVGGGFAETVEPGCEGEGCRKVLTAPPPMIGPESGVHVNKKSKGCPKGKRKVHRHGKARCVAKKHHRHHRRRAGSKQKGAGK